MKSGDVRDALRRYYPSQEYALVHEVAQATGFNANRHLDCIAMSLWPSRGLNLFGIEIKVNKYDWKKEKATPEKAEQIARFCDFFFIAAPAGLIPVEELPEAWGLIEVNEKGEIRQKKGAVKTESTPINREFLAAMLRASSRSMTKDEMEAKLDQARKRLEADYDERVKSKAARLSENNTKHSENWRNLITILGNEPDRFHDNHEVISAVKAVMKAGVANTWGGLETVRNTLRDSLKKCDEAFKMLAIDERKLG